MTNRTPPYMASMDGLLAIAALVRTGKQADYMKARQTVAAMMQDPTMAKQLAWLNRTNATAFTAEETARRNGQRGNATTANPDLAWMDNPSNFANDGGNDGAMQHDQDPNTPDIMNTGGSDEGANLIDDNYEDLSFMADASGQSGGESLPENVPPLDQTQAGNTGNQNSNAVENANIVRKHTNPFKNRGGNQNSNGNQTTAGGPQARLSSRIQTG